MRFLGLLLTAGAAVYAAAPGRAVLLVSVDGLRPDYVLEADRRGLKLPNLQAMVADGVSAAGVRGVLPSVTYSSHATLVTGVAPRTHGIATNHPFDPYKRSASIWHWYANEIRVPTLWQIATEAGYVTGSVSWPVTVGADAIRYNLPEYARTRDADDLKMIRGLATPGLYAELENKLGAYTNDVNDAIPRDWVRTKWAAEMIRSKRVRFMTVHLASTDHEQHAKGPFSAEAVHAVEEVDKMVGVLRDAILSVDPAAMVCVVSDHGFAAVDRQLKLDLAFVKAGLITLKTQGTAIASSTVADWKAMTWDSSGSAAVVLKNPTDEATRERVRSFLRELAANPENGIEAVLDRPEIAKMGGTREADFWVCLRPGYTLSGALSEPQVETAPRRGTHGYSPDRREMNSSFFLVGKGVRKGSVGEIDMRSIAPTIARLLGSAMPSAEAAAFEVFR